MSINTKWNDLWDLKAQDRPWKEGLYRNQLFLLKRALNLFSATTLGLIARNFGRIIAKYEFAKFGFGTRFGSVKYFTIWLESIKFRRNAVKSIDWNNL